MLRAIWAALMVVAGCWLGAALAACITFAVSG